MADKLNSRCCLAALVLLLSMLCASIMGKIINHSGDTLLTLTDCLFTGNKMDVRSSSRGKLTLRGCIFIGEAAIGSRGAIDFLGENLKLYDCEFRNIVASSVVGFGANLHGEFVAEKCAFIGNVGRPIYHLGSRIVITNCIFAGNRGGSRSGGVDSYSQYTIIRNCTFSGNSSERHGSALNLRFGGKMLNCIFWDNSPSAIDGQEQDIFIRYSNVQGGWPGEGNIEVDPCFISPGYWYMKGTPEDTTDDFWVDGDYHLQSQAGHWDQQSQTWIQDGATSPCIDAGDPNSPIGAKPFPNGGRVNMGAYGAGDKASKSYFGKPVCETIIAGDINGDCVVDFDDLMIIISHWMMRPEDLVNMPPTIRLIEPKDGDRIAWRGSTSFRAEAIDVDGHVDEVWFCVKYKASNQGTRGYGDTDGSDGWEREIIWPEDAQFGEWTIWAEATDNDGQIGITPEITVTLYRP